MLTNDDIAILRASAQAAIDNPTRPFTVAPQVARALIQRLDVEAIRRSFAEAARDAEAARADACLPDADRYLALKEMHPGQFAELYQRKLRGESFDALVDEMGAKP